MCRRSEIRRLDGEEARCYVAEHLRLIKRGRDPTGAGDYQREQTRSSWVLDFPRAGHGQGTSEHSGTLVPGQAPLREGHSLHDS
jgi:hypothetical protein